MQRAFRFTFSSNLLPISRLLSVKPQINVLLRILADFRVFLCYGFILLSQRLPLLDQECGDPAADRIKPGAGEGFNHQYIFFIEKIEVTGHIPEFCRAVATPGENLAFIF